MATFVTLNRDHSGEEVHVNMDKIISMERVQGGKSQYTVLTPETKDRSSISVTQTPQQILTLIRDEQRS